MKKGIRIGVLVALVGVFVAVLIINTTGSKPKNEDKVWDTAATMGDMNAKNLYVFYTDFACPYCDVWSRLILENRSDFEDYIKKNHILYEVRVTEFLYENSGHRPDMSRWGAKGAHCAAKQNKFWEYYDGGVKALWEDYHSKGIGSSKDAPMISGMTEKYWSENVAKKAGVNLEEFQSCFSSEDTLKEVQKKTEKASQLVESGLPYFAFGNWTQSGFDPSWDYNYVKQYLNAGLKK